MSLKLDISKAYDRVEQNFLESVMHKMGFGHAWMSRVMICIKPMSFSILINGEPKGLIKPSRGLCQGDSLSQYLFLLCTEGLISLLHQAVERKFFTSIRICKGAPSINHLLFVDDSLLFFKMDLAENRKVMELLKVYEQALKQKIKKCKTSMSFSRNVRPLL